MTLSNGAFSALLAIRAGNSLVTGEFPAQGPVTRSFEDFFNLYLNTWMSKQWWCWWFETPSRLSWRHCNAVPKIYVLPFSHVSYFKESVNAMPSQSVTYVATKYLRVTLMHLSISSVGDIGRWCGWYLNYAVLFSTMHIFGLMNNQPEIYVCDEI